MTYEEVLREGREYLLTAGIAEAGLNAWYLFSHCFHMDKSRFYLRSGEQASEEDRTRYGELLCRRGQHIPLEYITHRTEFMGLPFYVDESVLIPRQDTECLVEEVLPESEGKDILDLCTGSGCIGISLAALSRCRSVTLADISESALDTARRNARTNGVEVFFLRSDLFDGITGQYDIIVSNPPYIPSAEIDGLMPEVRDHEPRQALDGASDGLLFYRSIIKESRCFLREGGQIFFEIGYDQGEAVSRLMSGAGFGYVSIKKDLAGHDRVVRGTVGQK